MRTGNNTWKPVNYDDVMEGERKRNRIIGMSFPRQQQSLGLEPSILTVLPDGENVEYDPLNRDYNDVDVQYYLCSVYITGYEEFVQWALKHDKAKIVVGGYHPTTFPEQFTRYAGKVVTGPCDDFWATVDQPGQVVTGITTHKKLPRRDLYDVAKFNQQIIPDKRPEDIVVSINTSMGCPTNPPCDFCCTPIMCPRLLSSPIELVEREAAHLGTYDPAYCFIRDENFTWQKDWKKRIQLLHQNMPNTKLYLFASANTINSREKVKILAENGVYMICLGLEDPTKSYGKNEHLDSVVKLLKEHGIYTYLSFIANPLELIGKEEGENFYRLLTGRFQELKPEMVCGNFLMPFRGTPLWDKYYAFVDESDYKYYDSKTPFLVRNQVVREKMKFFMFWYQWQYFTSDFYRENVREFMVGDTLSLRFQELYNEFKPLYERWWNVRA